MSRAAVDAVDQEIDAGEGIFNLRRMLRFLRKDTAGMLGLALVLLVVFSAVFAPIIAPYDPTAGSFSNARLPPAWTAEGTTEHLLGTDQLGQGSPTSER